MYLSKNIAGAVLLISCLWSGLVNAVPPMQQPIQEKEAGKIESFDILEYEIEGNSVLPIITVEKAVYPYLGEGKSMSEVENARATLERAYRDAGYLTVLVDIPEQKIESGVVKLRVVEGSVERVKVTGSRYYSLGYIRSKVPSLTVGNVPNFPEVQKELAQLNRTADRRITPVLRPGKSPGKVEVELKVEDQFPLHANLELNNRKSANTEALRLSGMVRYDNLWQKEHSLSLSFQTAPQNTSQVKVFSGTYLFPIKDSNKLIALYGVHSSSDVAAVGDVNVLGNGDIYGLRAISPLPAKENYFHSYTLGIDYKDFKETVVLLGADSFQTPISYTPMMAQYSATMQDKTGITRFNMGANFAFREVLGNNQYEFENKRFKAKANYFYLKGDLERNQLLPKDMELTARADMQLAAQPLISNEQFSAGGVDSVRGYLESEQLGDDGLRGKLELRTPSLYKDKNNPASEFYFLGFLEGAYLHINEALPGQKSSSTLSSAGIGLRLKAKKNFGAKLDVGYPFKETAHTHRGDTRTHFSLTYEF